MTDDRTKKALAPYRKQIDALDDAIIGLLGKRYAVVREVAAYKIRHGLHMVHGKRVRQVCARNAKTARACGVSPDIVRALYTLIISEAHVIELEMKAGRKSKK